MNDNEVMSLIECFLREPDRYRSAFQENAASVLRVLWARPELTDRFDKAKLGLEDVYALLQAPLDSAEQGIVEGAVSFDESDDNDLREAVQTFLLADASPRERAITDKIEDPLELYQTTEAISTRVRRATKADATAADGLLWRTDGVVSGAGLLVTQSALALEVARFADLWSDDAAPWASANEPSPVASELVAWAWMCSRRVPGLLRHFVSDPRPDAALLRLREPSEWRIELGERWRPEGIARAVG